MIFAVAAIALVACSKEFDTNKSASNGTAIGFGTWTETMTKARTQGTNTWDNGDDFAVFGYKYRASGNPTAATVFDNVTVSYDGDWDYTNHRFWDVAYENYAFFAVSPAQVNSTTTAALAPQTGLVANSAEITFAGNNNDILVADKKVVARGNTPASYFANESSVAYGPVTIQFNHIASLVDLKVKKSANLANPTKVEVTAISLSNMDNTGTFAVTNYTDNAPHPTVAWTATTHNGTYTNASGVGGTVALPCDANSTQVTAEGVYLIQNLVAMPQTFRTDSNIQTVTLTYKITDDGGSSNLYENVTFNLKAFDTTDGDTVNNDPEEIASWAPGKHYVYTITIDANVISFTAAITNWTDAVGYHYLVN